MERTKTKLQHDLERLFADRPYFVVPQFAWDLDEDGSSEDITN